MKNCELHSWDVLLIQPRTDLHKVAPLRGGETLTTEEDRDPDGESKSPQSTPRGSLTAILPDAISEPLATAHQVDEAQVLPSSSGQSAAPGSTVSPVSARRSPRSSNSSASSPLRRELPKQPAEGRSPLARVQSALPLISARKNAESSFDRTYFERTDVSPTTASESTVPRAV